MDNSSSLIIVNLIINVMLFLNHLIDRVKRSSCFGSNIEFNDNITNKDTPRFQPNYDLQKILELLDKKNDTVGASGDVKIDIKDNINKV